MACIPGLTQRQNNQLIRQLSSHLFKSILKLDIPVSKELLLKNFLVFSGVMRPDIMSSLVLAKYLFTRREIYANKSVLDMGCGSGIQGIVMAMAGAKHVYFSDNSVPALKNTNANVRRFRLIQKSSIIGSDLFSGFMPRVEIVVFNHPFFAARPFSSIPTSASMMDSGGLIKRFFRQVKFCNPEMIIMPFYHLAGNINNPQVQAPRFDFKVSCLVRSHGIGLQRGKVAIYAIRWRGNNNALPQRRNRR
jgi:hypothetical protein